MPPPLPPDIALDFELSRRLSAADHALGLLAGRAQTLPNPHPLSRTLVRREAVLSSRIEGTQASLSELVLEAEAKVVDDRDLDALDKMLKSFQLVTDDVVDEA